MCFTRGSRSPRSFSNTGGVEPPRQFKKSRPKNTTRLYRVDHLPGGTQILFGLERQANVRKSSDGPAGSDGSSRRGSRFGSFRSKTGPETVHGADVSRELHEQCHSRRGDRHFQNGLQI